MVFKLKFSRYWLALALFISIIWVNQSSAGELAEELSLAASETLKNELDNEDDLNSGIDSGAILEEELDVEDEQNEECGREFNANAYRVLKAYIDGNNSSSDSRDERQLFPGEEFDPDDVIKSMFDLEVSQILGPVLNILASAAANNATAIEENYKKLPVVARYEATQVIKFAVDLLTTT